MNLKKSFFFLLVINLFVFSSTAYATDFYWVGNSGNWNDASHWSATSGGNGGFGTPTVNDDVTFDKKSFKKKGTLSILGNAFCNSFNWKTAKPVTLEGSKNTSLKVNGSFDVNTHFKNAFLGRVVFTSNQLNNTISAVRKDFAGDIEFNGSGSWNVISNIITPNNKTIFLTQGEVIATNVTFSTGGLDASGALNKKMTLTDAIFYVEEKMVLDNAPNFTLTRNNTNIIINNKAKGNNLKLAAFNPNSFSYTNNFRLLNTCGAVPLTVTLTVLTNFNGFGESCVGSCDGIVYVTYTGGVGPFTTSWPSQPTVTGDTIYNVCSADNPIRVIIEDLGQPTPPFGNLTCEETINITSPPLMVVSLLGTIEPSCNADCNGIIGVNVLFGVPTYNITWTNTPQTTPIISGLCAGSYTISIVDQNLCTLDSTFVLTEPAPISFDIDSNNINCFGACSGEAWVSNIVGGNGAPYTFLWTNPVSNNDSISGLCAGNYVVTVSDDSLCFAKDSVNIIEPPQMIITSSNQNVSCGGLCDGSATVTVNSGGVPPYTHNWSTNQVDVGLNSTINGLCFGTYTDSIVDAFGCDTVITFNITQPNVLTTTTTSTNVTCNGLCDGTATTVPAGGTPPYNSIVYDMIPTQAPFPFNGDPVNNLCIGTYFVTVTDNNSCTVQDTFSITEPLVLVANASSTNVTCPGFCDGTATASPTGGTTPYSYTWTGLGGPYNTQTINSLCPGQYILTVLDSNNNCTAKDTVTITEPLVLNLAMSSTDETCGGLCDGTATVSVTGGSSPYTFIWVPDPTVPNGQGTDSIFNLCPGNYTVNVTDAGGCSANNNVTINPQTPILINLTTSDLSCNGVCNGSATVTPAGGVAPYDIQWNGGGFVTGDNNLPNLCAGNYTVDVRDANGCITSSPFVITEPQALTTTSNGTNLNCNGVCNGTATTAPAGGTAPYVVTWVDLLGTVYNGTVLNNLCAGTYIATITDDSLCTLIDTVIITEPALLDPNAQFTPISCNGLNNGTAISIPIGGTPNYTYSWSGNGGPYNSQAIGPLSAGQYIVTVTDGNNCTAKDTINLIDPPVLTVNATATNASCGAICDGIATATPNGGTPGYTYQWDDPANQITPIATGLCAGTYTVIVTDANGCTAQDVVTITNLIIIQITPSVIGISCNGVCDGTATATATGGVLPYTFLWSNGDTTPTADSLCPGFVYVTVTDANGCVTLDSINMPIAPPVLFPNGSLDQGISCNGACDAMVSSAPTGGTTPYTVVWTLPNGTDTNNVCPPFAIVTVTDANGCIQADTLTVIEPDSIAPNPTIVHVNCNGDSTGSITLAPTGGNPGYIYSWLPGGQNTPSITNQPAGSYTVTITDLSGCSKTITYTINEPSALTASPIFTNMSCFGICDGMATVTVGGGTPPYIYNWSPGGETTDTIFNLCAGNYSVLATDANGCTVSQNFVITEPVLLDANVTGTNISCGGGVCDGTAISNPLGGTSPYTYSWSANAAPNILTNSSITNLCTAIYTVTVTDTNGCTANDTYEVTTPTMIAVTLDSTNITCNGLNDGTATATPTGGIPPYTYLWTGACIPVPANTPAITNLCAGIYTVTVTDAAGCFFTGSVNITEPTPIDDNEVITLANCGVSDGSICTFSSGGTPFYTHSWSNGATTTCINNVPAGFYTDTITDFNGCSNTFTYSVSNPTGPSGVTPTVNDATCFGSCDGAINVIVIGGVSPFSYAWTSVPVGGPYANDSTITGLCAGTYSLTVIDASNCQLNTTIIVGEADSIAPNPVFTDATCNGNCDGNASVSPSGGTAPYTFSWSNGQTTSSVSNLCVGAISVTITDANGCTKVENFNIASPNVLTTTTSKTDATCNGSCDGTATTNPTGGTAPYTYFWDDALVQTTQTAITLCAGTYNVTITDFNGCSVTVSETIAEPSLIIANETTTPATCGNSDGSATVVPTGGTGPYTYLWCNGVTTATANALPAGTCNLDITDANGCTQTFLININNTGGPTVTVSSTNASCNGVCDGTASATVTSGVANYTFLWAPGGQTTSSISGLCAGNYTVQVTDANGCITVEPVTIIDNTAITATLTTTDATCNGTCDGTATVVPTGGVPPYQYNWAGGVAAGQTTNSVGGLCAGNYTATITDALGCTFIQNVVINEPNILTVTPIGVAANCNGSCDGSATANPTGGTAPFTYLWSTGATTPNVVGLCAGSYTVTVTDANGCSSNGAVNIGEGALITATVNTNDATCGICDGSATIVGAGGAGAPFTYTWSPGGQTTSTVNNLCPGAYQVDITDALGCTQTFNVLVNNLNGPAISATADSVTCFGACNGTGYVTITSGTPTYTFQWDDIALQTNDTATGLCAGLYNIVVQDGLGCITVDSVTVQEPQELLANISFTNPSCPFLCDGTATANPTGGIAPYTFQWNPGPATGNINALCSGTYFLTITDANGCSITDSITLTDPTPINIALSATTTTCNGDCDATIFSVVSGGTPAYNYSWNTTPIQTNTLANGLCAGNYILTVTDNNGCVQTDNITVVDPPVLSTTSNMTPLSCNGVCDGSITTNPAGGVPPYAYIWSDGQTTQTASNLCAGTYNVVVSDFNNCTAYDTIIVTEPNILNDSTVVTGPTCGLCDGSATSTPFGGIGAFTFIWTDPITGLVLQTTVAQASSTVVGLCAGTVDLQITDLGSGCISNHTIIVNNSTGPNVVITSTDETCTSACDGTALASATAGTTPYTFNWDSNPAQVDSNATNLCAGFYTVTVTDAAGCITTDTVTIKTNGLNLTISNVIPETCFGDCDGSATVTSSSGVNPFTYIWNPTAQVTPTAINLCVGTYVATVTDNLNCSDSISTNITGPTILTVSATENSAIACNSNCDGAAIATPLGGNPNYTYQWNDPLNQTTQVATGLCAGTYIVVVTDNNGCSASDTIILGEPSAILANEVLTAPNCNQCDGAITLAPSGGVGPYTFIWTTPTSPPNPNTGIINNLCAGGYSVDITDATGCTATFNFPLSSTNAPLPNTTITNVSCFGVCDGSITSAASGGTNPYTYLWSPAGGNGANATNLCAGVYTLNVTDDLGCIGVAIDSVSQPGILQANITSTNIVCAGACDGATVANPIGGTAPFTYNWTPVNLAQDSITNLCAGNYTVTITDDNNCSVQDVAVIIEPNAILTTSAITPTSCSANCDGAATLTTNGGVGPYAFQWNGNTANGQTNTQSGLCFGLNTILITDNSGCSIIDSIYVGATDTILANAGNDTTICLGNNVNLTGIAGGNFANVEWFELVTMTSLGTGNTINVNPTLVGTTCYIYQVTGNCVVSDTVCVTTDALPLVDAGTDVTIIEGTSTTLNATGGGSYLWTPTSTLSDSTIFNPVATPDSTTTYYVTVTSTGGCTATDSVIVIVLPTVEFPNGITPNGDGQNDVWIIDFIEQYPNNVVEIYNRWGELLFHADGYLQDWDGTYNGKNLPIGTYYYIIDLGDEKVKPFTGPITILR